VCGSAPARRTRPSRVLNSARVAARWRGRIGIGDWGLGWCPCTSSYCRRLDFLAFSSPPSPSPPSPSLLASSSPQQNVPVFQKKHQVHRGLHMQQSHSSRNGCCLVAIMASSNACVVRPRRSRTTTSVESASMSQHQRSTVERQHEARSMKHEA
jgi:hypothetical protein